MDASTFNAHHFFCVIFYVYFFFRDDKQQKEWEKHCQYWKIHELHNDFEMHNIFLCEYWSPNSNAIYDYKYFNDTITSIPFWTKTKKKTINKSHLFQSQHSEWPLHLWNSFCQEFSLASQIYQKFESIRRDLTRLVATQTWGRCLTLKCHATLTLQSSFRATNNHKLIIWLEIQSTNKYLWKTIVRSLPVHLTLYVYNMCWDRLSYASFWHAIQSIPTNSCVLWYLNARLVMHCEI